MKNLVFVNGLLCYWLNHTTAIDNDSFIPIQGIIVAGIVLEILFHTGE